MPFEEQTHTFDWGGFEHDRGTSKGESPPPSVNMHFSGTPVNHMI